MKERGGLQEAEEMMEEKEREIYLREMKIAIDL